MFEGEYLNDYPNGKGTEYYDNGQIKFIGEYSNGKRWNGNGYDIYGNKKFEIKEGKGHIKEYEDHNYNLIFEGDYLNGEKNGYGKEFYKNGYIKFEGEYLNEKRWNGKIYDKYGNNEYEIKEGKVYIKEYNEFNDKLLFEREYLNGEKEKENNIIFLAYYYLKEKF